MGQKKIKARVKKIIEVDGLKFKDLYGDGELKPYEDWRLAPEERAEDLISRMTVQEKAGMLLVAQARMGISVKDKEKTSHNGLISEESGEIPLMPGRPPRFTKSTTDMIEKEQLRHYIVREMKNSKDMAEWADALEEMCEGTRLGIPAIIMSNARNNNGAVVWDESANPDGYAMYPENLGVTAAGQSDPQAVSDFAAESYINFKSSNIRKGYVYMADCATDPRWFRTHETFGENPQDIAKIITELIKTHQGDKLGENSVSMTTKHFPGGGARENGFDPHYAEGKYNVYRTPGSLEKYHIPGFKAAIDAGTTSMMPYYAIPSEEKSVPPHPPVDEPFEQVGMAFNKAIVTDLLRDKLGFKGYVNSDSGILQGMAWGVEDLTMEQRIAKAINAGTDVIAISDKTEDVVSTINAGLIDEKRLHDALSGLLCELFRLGLFENPYSCKEELALTGSPEGMEKAYKVHQESVTLLKNHNGLLPLTADKLAGKKVYLALFEQEETKGAPMGGGGRKRAEEEEKFRAAAKTAFPDVCWVDEAEGADIAIAILNPQSGSYFAATEGYLDLGLGKGTGIDTERLDAVRAAAGKLICHVNLPMPFLLGDVEPKCDALTVGYGTFIKAVCDVIFGRFAPCGRLSLTIPAGQDVIAVDENAICASPNDVPGFEKSLYMDGKEYAYVDADGNKYIYGFGLSY